MNTYARGRIVLMVCLWLPGCSQPEKVSFDPPADLIANELSVNTVADGHHAAGRIPSAGPFVVTGAFFSKSRLRNKVMIRVIDLSGPDKPITMQSGIAAVTSDGDSQYSYKADLKGIRNAGNYEVQVLYGTKVVDKGDIVVEEQPGEG
jgi:hypothetical protein